MPQPVSLLLGVHNHQPVDNWDHVIEDATKKCYQPFLDVLEAHPRIGMSIHYTGYLLDWLVEHHPALIEQLGRLVRRGQVEMITGGYYEPVLAVIPDEDKRAQVERLSARIQDLAGVTPRGLWLAERVWEPHLPKSLAQAGVDYLFLDDSHFAATGMEESAMRGRYVSEEQGHCVDIFPVSKMLRYQIPYAAPQEIIDGLRALADDTPGRAAIYFDDGEKFGVWPGTYKSVFREKWLDRFFTTLEENADVIQAVTPAQYVAQHPPLGRIYLPTASYGEMMEWAMPAAQINHYEQALRETPPAHQRFLRGGFWRNFLVKYPEANNIHKKMLHVSAKIRRAEAKAPDAPALAEAKAALWKGQSNDIFWHGVFGGLYLTNLRSANFSHLLRAETLADSLLSPTPNGIEMVETDFDCDGQPEVLLETPLQNLYFDPDEGGCLFELDFRPKDFNLLDTLARRYEAYHDKLSQAVHSEDADAGEAATIHDRVVSKHRNLDQYLHYDWHRRTSLLDHFLRPDTTLETMAQSSYGEQGDFVNQPYAYDWQDDVLTLSRTGTVWDADQSRKIRVEKAVSLPDGPGAVSQITYTVANLSEATATLWFTPEFNVNFLAPDAPDRYYYLPEPAEGKLKDKRLVSKGELTGISAIGLRDEWLGIDYALSFDRAGNVWRFPIQTVSQSEAGFEKVYQSSVLLPNWQLALAPGESWRVVITQTISALTGQK